MWKRLFSSADLLQKGLSASWARNAAIRNNIANAETPHFKASDVAFESVLLDTLEQRGVEGKRTREKHRPIGRASFDDVAPQVRVSRAGAMRMDGNNVDIEAENVKLAQNSLMYNTVLAKLNSELARIKLAISEGK